MTPEIQVRVADLQAASGETVLVTLGVGSCIAVLLHDPAAAVGGLAHVLLPSRSLSRAGDNPGRFPQSAVPSGSMNMGDRNVIAAREVLNHLAIPIVGEAVGGTQGRSVWFHVGEGRILVRRVMEREQLL